MAALATAGLSDSPPAGDGDSGSVQRLSVDQRPDGQRAAHFIREAQKHSRQVEKLEREKTLSVQCRKNGWTDVAGELDECEKTLEGQRNAQKMHLQKQLVKVHNGVRKFQRQLRDVKPTPALIERLKEIMSEVEISINALKEEQRSSLEELLKEERTSKQEVAAYEKKIENFLSLAVKPRHAAPTVKTKPLHRDLPAEVRALEVFLLKAGGPCGGWDQYDHEAFLKVWTKHNGQPAYRKEAKLYLSGKTADEIQQHEDWQRQLVHLQDRKREAIRRWKTGKQRQRQTRIQSQEEVEEAGRREEEARSRTHLHRTEEERREAARRLEEWKEEKRRNKEREEEQRLAEEILKERRAKEERRRQLEVKLSIEEQLRRRREEEEEQTRRRREEEQMEQDERRREAAKAIKLFTERDLHKVEAKLQEKHVRAKEEEERRRRITAKLKEKADGHVSRDPSRLTRPTRGWEERLKHIGPSGEPPLLQMFHRAVPTWRQGL